MKCWRPSKAIYYSMTAFVPLEAVDIHFTTLFESNVLSRNALAWPGHILPHFHINTTQHILQSSTILLNIIRINRCLSPAKNFPVTMPVVTLKDRDGQTVIHKLCPTHGVKPPVTAATITTIARELRQQVITGVFNDAIQQEMATFVSI